MVTPSTATDWYPKPGSLRYGAVMAESTEVVTLVEVVDQPGVARERSAASRRQRLIDANPELHEREVARMSRLAMALAAALRSRGVEETTAIVAAETGSPYFG